jgi:hypothetical protein
MQLAVKYGLLCLFIFITHLSWSDDELIDYLTDPSSQMALEDVLNTERQWQSTPRNRSNFGFTEDSIWLRVKLNNQSSSAVTKHLRINYPLLDHVDAYLIDHGQAIEHKYLSDHVAYNDDRNHDKYYLFSYQIPPQTNYSLYIRIETQSSMTLPIEVFNDAEYVQQKNL